MDDELDISPLLREIHVSFPDMNYTDDVVGAVVVELCQYYKKPMTPLAKAVWVQVIKSQIKDTYSLLKCFAKCIATKEYLPTPIEFIKTSQSLQDWSEQVWSDLMSYYEDFLVNPDKECPLYLLEGRDFLRSKMKLTGYKISTMTESEYERKRKEFISNFSDSLVRQNDF